MTLRLSTRDAGFDAAFTALVNARREADEDVSRDVSAILKRIRDEGDAALADYTQRFDRHDLAATGWSVTAAERKAALNGLSNELSDTLDLSAGRLAAFTIKQQQKDRTRHHEAGVRPGVRGGHVDKADGGGPGG